MTVMPREKNQSTEKFRDHLGY